MFQVEPRQGEKPYAYEVKRPQATALTRASHPQSFFSVRPAQTKPVRNMAPLASHITVSPYQDIPPPHMTPVTPVPPKNPAHHSTQTGGRPLPCWLPVSLLPCLQLPRLAASRLFMGCQAQPLVTREPLPCPSTLARWMLVQPPCPAPAPPPADQLVSWRRLQAGQWTRPPGGGPHLCCRQTPAPTGTWT